MLYGRDAERAAIGGLLESARDSRSGALVLRGEAGIGKTALLEDARDRAADMHVLAATGVESESELAFAALDQLLRPALVHLEQLPAPQASALRGALGLESAVAEERFLVFAACLSLLAELADRRPVLCLIDDAQWLDAASTDAMLFVARRLGVEGIVMLFAAREPDARRFESRELAELEVTALDSASAAALVARHVDGDIAPTVMDRLLAQSHGNALALRELPTTLSADQLSGSSRLPDELPLPPAIGRLYLDRVRKLPRAAQRLLLIAVAADTGRLAPVIRAAETLGIDGGALSAAEDAGLLSVRGTSFELRHPLVRSTVYHAASSADRREVHLALAAALDDDLEADQRAWHRAAAALEPDEEVAEALERTAARARVRSGHGAAATALERAAELSGDGDRRVRRLVSAAQAAWHGGQPERATGIIDEVSPVVADPRLRTELDHLRGVIQFWSGSLLDASDILIAAAEAARSVGPRKALELLFDAAEASAWAGDFPRMAEVADRAAQLGSDASEDDLFLANLLVGVGGLFAGRTGKTPAIVDVIAQADELEQPRWLVWAASAVGVAGDEARETALLRRATALARSSGSVEALTHVLVTVAVRGLLEGRLQAVGEAEEGLALAREAALPNAASLHLAVLAWFAALQGRDDECRARAADVNDAARAARHGFANSIAEWAVGFLDLGAGRLDEAIARLDALSTARPGVGQAFIALASTPDRVEACIRAGRDESARQASASFQAFAAPGAPRWALALAARCRALVPEGDPDAQFADALRLHSESNRPLDRARTELLFGEHLRRSRRRRESRRYLRGAIEAFEALGADPWAERARSELRAAGETARKRDPSTVDQLTPQELQIARMVAEGLSNKEVAAQLYLSPRTIDYHLRNVFAKLGLTSRTQLARLPLGDDQQAAVEQLDAAVSG